MLLGFFLKVLMNFSAKTKKKKCNWIYQKASKQKFCAPQSLYSFDGHLLLPPSFSFFHTRLLYSPEHALPTLDTTVAPVASTSAFKRKHGS